jgi:hypothetical protein
MARVGADLGNSRELYFASAATAMLLAVLMAGIVQAHLRTTAATVLAMVFACGAWHNLAAWRFDSLMSRQIPAELMRLYPQPPPGTEFEINDLPRSFRGIYFYQTGLDAAVQLAYGRKDIGVRRGSDLQSSSEFNRNIVKLCFQDTLTERVKLVSCPSTYSPGVSP